MKKILIVKFWIKTGRKRCIKQ